MTVYDCGLDSGGPGSLDTNYERARSDKPVRQAGPTSDPHWSVFSDMGYLRGRLASFTTQLCVHLAQDLETLHKQELSAQAERVNVQISDMWGQQQHLAPLPSEHNIHFTDLPKMSPVGNPESEECREGNSGKCSFSSARLIQKTLDTQVWKCPEEHQ